MAEAIFTVTSSDDPRLEQSPQTFCAAKGASAVSTVSVQAASFSASTLVFSVIPPSPQVVIQKAPQLDLTAVFQVFVLQSDGTGTLVPGYTDLYNSNVAMNPNGVPLGVWGRDICVGAAFPLGRLASTAQAQINNVTTTMQNVSQPDLSHIWEGPKGRATHGTTTRTPLTASWDDSFGTQWGLQACAGEMQGEGDMGPGGYTLMGWADDTGAQLPYLTVANFYPGGFTDPNTPSDGYKAGAPTPNSTWYQYGVPITDIQGAGAVKALYPILRLIDSTVIQPWAINYQRSFEETGLFGISAYTLTLQLQPGSQARIFQNSTMSGCIMLGPAQAGPPGAAGASGDIKPNSFGSASSANNLSAARLWMTYLSPSIQSTLPARSITSLCNFQYFQQSVVVQNKPLVMDNKVYKAQSVNIISWSSTTFSNVPDLIMISVRPDPAGMKPSEADWCCTFPDSAFQQFTFANQSGLFSGFTSAMMKQMSINNGLRTPMAAQGGSDDNGFIMVNNRPTIVGGAPMLIRPGVDFPLPTGVTVGSTGQVQLNFQLQFNAPRNGTYICTVTALSSGYFVTDSGVSRQLLVGLDEATVLQAPKAPDRFMTQRLAGGSMTSMGASHANGAMARLMKAVASQQESGSGGRLSGGSLMGGATSGGAGDWDMSGCGDGGAGSKRGRMSSSGFGASLAARLTRNG